MPALLTTLRDGALVPSLLTRLTEPIVDRWPGMLFAALNGSLAARDRSGALSLTGSGAVRYQAAEGARTNSFTNPSLETNGAAWFSITNATATRSQEQAWAGSWSYKVVANGAGDAGLTFGNTSNADVAMQQGDAYTVSVYVYASGGAVGRTFTLQVNEAGGASGDAVISGAITNQALVAGWQRIVKTGTIQVTGRRYLYAIQRIVAPANGDTIYLDAAQFERGSTATPFFDGSTLTGAAWINPITGLLGAAHASPSVSRAAAWVEEGTTNTVPDPSFEAATITTNWTAQGAAAISKVTSHAYVGSNGGKVVCTANTADGIHQLATSGAAAANGQAWTVSGRVRAFAAGDVGKTVKPAIIERTSGDAVVATNLGSAITLTDAWQSFASTVTLAGGGTVAKATCGVMAGAAVAVDFALDAVNLCQKAYATSHIDGSLGTGYSWAGTAHASASTRAATTVKADETGRIKPEQGSIWFWYCRKIDTGGNQTLFDAGDGTAGKDRVTLCVNASDQFEMAWQSDGAAATTVAVTSPTLAVDAWNLLYAGWEGTTVAVSVAGGARATGARNAPQGDLGSVNDIAIGSLNTGTAQADGLIGPLTIEDRPLTDMEIARVKTLGPAGVFFDSIRDAA